MPRAERRASPASTRCGESDEGSCFALVTRLFSRRSALGRADESYNDPYKSRGIPFARSEPRVVVSAAPGTDRVEPSPEGTPEFGVVLRRLRLAAELSQERLAERANISLEAVSTLERGTRRAPQRETISRLAEALELAGSKRVAFETAARAVRSPREAQLGRREGDGDRTVSHNLPLALTSFHGRERELAELTQHFDAQRLVTLVGPGGVGKTRLAVELAFASVARFPQGAWFADLAPLTEPSLILFSVAALFGVREQPGRALLDTVAAALRAQWVLLILDNCEHVLGEAARVAEQLVRACPNVHVVATTREPLRVGGELVYRVDPLEVPPVDVARPPLDEVAASPAVRLFVDRAAATTRDFATKRADYASIATIVRRLDGLPLAIELAAARVPSLSPRQIADALDARLRLLTAGSRTAQPRQQTLRAAIDWSHALLSEPERVAFRRLAIFAGGWPLEAAEAVCAGGGIDPLGVLDLLSSLVAKSLVVVDFGEERTRYRMLESTREYGLEKLIDSGERPSLARRQAEWVSSFVEGADETYWTLPLARWLRPFEGEFDNLRAALFWALEERGDPMIGGRIAGAVHNLWFNAGLAREGRRWIDVALAALDEKTHPGIVGRLWLAQASGIAFGEARVLAAKRAICCIEPLGDRLRLANALSLLAWGHFDMQSLGPSLDATDRALLLLKTPGLTQLVLLVVVLMHRGTALVGLERYSEARSAFGEALELCREMGDERRRVRVEINLAELEFAVGQLPAALALARAAASRAREAADIVYEALAHANAAAYHLVLRETDEAKGEARAALTLARLTQHDLFRNYAIQHLATVAVLERDVDRAARLRGYVDAWYRARGYGRELTEQRTYDILMAELCARSTDERLAELAEAGALLSDDAAAALAEGASCDPAP